MKAHRLQSFLVPSGFRRLLNAPPFHRLWLSPFWDLKPPLSSLYRWLQLLLHCNDLINNSPAFHPKTSSFTALFIFPPCSKKDESSPFQGWPLLHLSFTIHASSRACSMKYTLTSYSFSNLRCPLPPFPLLKMLSSFWFPMKKGKISPWSMPC